MRHYVRLSASMVAYAPLIICPPRGRLLVPIQREEAQDEQGAVALTAGQLVGQFFKGHPKVTQRDWRRGVSIPLHMFASGVTVSHAVPIRG